mmetsp:Transcript_71787/g.83450  ORF Transcript_71787/g.83450 Transcript_71787/m.83450 type:complete len:138 (-) Transcript_71787:151-564(-)
MPKGKDSAANQDQQFQVKPKRKEKFKPGEFKKTIKEYLAEKFKTMEEKNKASTQIYQADSVMITSKEIAEDIKQKLKLLNLPRYKYIVQVTIGEQKGQGVRVGSKCFWDFDTDYCTFETYLTDSLFVLVTVYAIYLY